MYQPFMVFGTAIIILLLVGLVPFIRYLLFFFDGTSRGHLQSLIFGMMLIAGAFSSITLGIIADLIRINRILNEDELEHTKQMRFNKK